MNKYKCFLRTIFIISFNLQFSMENEQILVLTIQFHREDYMFNNPKRKRKTEKWY